MIKKGLLIKFKRSETRRKVVYWIVELAVKKKMAK